MSLDEISLSVYIHRIRYDHQQKVNLRLDSRLIYPRRGSPLMHSVLERHLHLHQSGLGLCPSRSH